MRIALVSTCAAAVPPSAYGGTERFVAVLAHALVAHGHEVIVFATGDSQPAGALRSRFPHAIWPPDYEAEREHAAFAWREAACLGVDIIHLNSPDALSVAPSAHPPALATLHHACDERLLQCYLAHPEIAPIAISRRQAELHRALGALAVIHHGLDTRPFSEGPGAGGYCAFVGRIGPEKAPHVAIDAARTAGVRLLLAGPHWTGQAIYDDYFAREMAPRLRDAGEAFRWLGELRQAEKVQLMRNASALLMPMGWEEPFGLVMIEAMLVGTPVIAERRGSAPEIVEPGVTGFLVSDTQEMASALKPAASLERSRCAARARERFSAGRMAASYEAAYRRIAR